MLLKISVLFFTVIIFGSVGFLSFAKKDKVMQFMLVFSGGYLLAITVLHIFPDVFSLNHHHSFIGLYVLAGFFFQLFLEFFSKGIEHGHSHETQKKTNIFTLLLALCIHAFFDGLVLIDCDHHLHTEHHHHSHLLWGIVLHKVPVAFVLVTFLSHMLRNKKYIFLLLLLFAFASPIGLYCSQYLHDHHVINPKNFVLFFAFASGSFLHITTTIFFEFNTEGHHLNFQKLFISFLGALAATVLEYAI